MISFILTSLLVVWLTGIAITVYHIRNAPVGVEDETGFHVIHDPEAGLELTFENSGSKA
jgi:hypothetical protein